MHSRFEFRQVGCDAAHLKWTAPSTASLHLASLASPKDYLDHPIETLESDRPATRNMLELARANRRPVPADVHVGVLWRSAGASAGGDLLGQRESGGPAVLLRRKQALRRSAHHGLPPRPRPAHEHRADLQYLRSAHAAQGWARGAGLYRSGAAAAKPLTIFGDGTQTRSFCYVQRSWWTGSIG